MKQYNNLKPWKDAYKNNQSKEPFWSYFTHTPPRPQLALPQPTVQPSSSRPQVTSLPRPTVQLDNRWHGKDCENDSDCGQTGRCYQFTQYTNAPKKCVCSQGHIFVQSLIGGSCASLE